MYIKVVGFLYLPDDHDALVELSGSLPQWMRAMECVQGTLEIVGREEEGMMVVGFN